MTEKNIAYKAFDQNMQCRGFQFEVGKTYKLDGEVKACESGFHACENPLDMWNYYPLNSRYAVVELGGNINRHADDSKIAAAQITILAEITLSQIISDGVARLMGLCKDALAASGDYSKLAASGDDSNLVVSGHNSKLAASGDYSNLAASGYYSNLAASGDYSKLAASGHDSKLAASGHDSKLAASGDYSKLAASGGYSNLVASGKNSICMAAGYASTAQVGENGVIVLPYYDGIRTRVAVGYVGENGIEPNVEYKVNNNNGIFEKVNM